MKRGKTARKNVFIILLSVLVLLTTIEFSSIIEAPPGPFYYYYGYIHDINNTVSGDDVQEMTNSNITITLIYEEPGDENETYNLTSDSYGFYSQSFLKAGFIPHTVNYTIEKYDEDSKSTIVGYYEFLQQDAVDKRVDPIYNIDENNWEWYTEANSLSYTSSPHIDFEVVDIRFSKDNPDEGDNITIYADVKNRGVVSLFEGVTVHFFNDSNFIQSSQISGLSSNETKNASISWNNLTAGYHNIMVIVDSLNVHLEIREQWNNDRTENIDVWKWISGDWNVTTSEKYSSIPIVVDGNLNVKSGGNLTLNNSELKIKSGYDGEHKINVLSGGKFYLFNSEVTAYDENSTYRFELNSLTKIYYSDISYMMNGVEIYSTNVTIVTNNISNSEGAGIYIKNISDQIIINNNRIFSNDGDGIFFNNTSLFESFQTSLNANNISSNGGAGFNLTSDSNITSQYNIINLNLIGINCVNSDLSLNYSAITNSSLNDIKMSGNSSMTLLDPVLNNELVNISDASELTVKRTLTVYTQFSNNRTIFNATVEITDALTSIVSVDQTDIRGSVTTHLIEYNYTSIGPLMHTPHNIFVFKHGGYGSLIPTLMDKAQDKYITISGPEVTVPGNLTVNITGNSTINLKVQIDNCGNMTLNNVTIEFYEAQCKWSEDPYIFGNYSLIGNDTINSIAQNDSEIVSVEWNGATEGMRIIKIVADSNGNISEVDEDNNEKGIFKYIDFNNTKPYVVYGYVLDGNGTKVPNASITITNGVDTINDTTDPEGKYDQNLLNFDNNYTFTDTINITASYPGQQNSSYEFNPGNKSGILVNLTFPNLYLNKSSPPQVLPGTNLRSYDVEFWFANGNKSYSEKANTTLNRTLQVQATVYNLGTTNLTNITVRFLDGQSQIGDNQTISSISSGETAITQVQWVAATIGTHTIKAIVDPDDEIAETDENDNEINQSKFVQKKLHFVGVNTWNKVTLSYTGQNIKASSVISRSMHMMKFVVYYSPSLNMYINYIDGFSLPEFDDFEIGNNLLFTCDYWDDIPIAGSPEEEYNYCIQFGDWAINAIGIYDKSYGIYINDGLFIRDVWYGLDYYLKVTFIPWIIDGREGQRYELTKDNCVFWEVGYTGVTYWEMQDLYYYDYLYITAAYYLSDIHVSIRIEHLLSAEGIWVLKTDIRDRRGFPLVWDIPYIYDFDLSHPWDDRDTPHDNKKDWYKGDIYSVRTTGGWEYPQYESSNQNHIGAQIWAGGYDILAGEEPPWVSFFKWPMWPMWGTAKEDWWFYELRVKDVSLKEWEKKPDDIKKDNDPIQQKIDYGFGDYMMKSPWNHMFLYYHSIYRPDRDSFFRIGFSL